MTIRQDFKYTIYNKPTKQELPSCKVKSTATAYGTINTAYPFTGISSSLYQLAAPTGVGCPWMKIGNELKTPENLFVTGMDSKISWQLDPSLIVAGVTGAQHGQVFGLEIRTDEADTSITKKYSPDIMIHIEDSIIDAGLTGISTPYASIVEPSEYVPPSSYVSRDTKINVFGKPIFTDQQIKAKSNETVYGEIQFPSSYSGISCSAHLIGQPTGAHDPFMIIGGDVSSAASMSYTGAGSYLYWQFDPEYVVAAGVTGAIDGQMYALRFMTDTDKNSYARKYTYDVLVDIQDCVVDLGITGPDYLNIYQGPQGHTGYQGETGMSLPGYTGLMGPTGLIGPTGAQGETGGQGQTGAIGIIGYQGATGVQGETGALGLTGPVGATGAIGSTGSQGSTGVRGETGAIGFTGAQGHTGAIGSTGSQGDTGSQGETGAIGLTGAQGYTGSQGETGVIGPYGVTGAQGYTGVSGETGLIGPTGYQGETGAQGYTGAGIQGETGLIGPTGIPGTIGIDGVTGIQGSTGAGIQGVTGLGNFYEQGNFTDALNVPAIMWNLTDEAFYGFVTGLYGNWIQISAGSKIGATGLIGPVGLTGSQGQTGSIGSTGSQGLTGIVGQTGAIGFTGYQGQTGLRGLTGSQGNTGSQGQTGAIGFTGLRGLTGLTGLTGAQGLTGAKGSVGQTGSQGSVGTSGATGVAGVTIDSFSGHLELPSNKTYTLDQYAPTAYVINSLICKTGGGTGMVTCKIDSTAITSLDKVWVSNSEVTMTASGSNSVAEGNSLYMNFTGINSAVDFTFSMKITR